MLSLLANGRDSSLFDLELTIFTRLAITSLFGCEVITHDHCLFSTDCWATKHTGIAN